MKNLRFTTAAALLFLLMWAALDATPVDDLSTYIEAHQELYAARW